MENIINSILEIEQNGRERLENAIKERNQIIADAKAEEEKIINSRLEEVDRHLKELEEKEKLSADSQLSVIEENMKKEIEHLDKVFSEKHDLWINEIFSAIVNG